MAGIEPYRVTYENFGVPDKNGFVATSELYILKDGSKRLYARAWDIRVSISWTTDNPQAKTDLQGVADPIEAEPFKNVDPKTVDAKPDAAPPK